MLKITRLADYACSIMVSLAKMPEHSWTAAKIAKTNRIQLPVTRKILKQLHQKNLLSSVRGAQGGYQLARPVDTISLCDIVEAIDGPISLTLCAYAEQTCEHVGQCHTQAHWQRINALLKEQLTQCSLKEMCGVHEVASTKMTQEVIAGVPQQESFAPADQMQESFCAQKPSVLCGVHEVASTKMTQQMTAGVE